MIKRVLLKIRQLIDAILGESPEETPHQQKVTVVGDNNTIIIDGNQPNNLIIPKTKTNVKHFPRKTGKRRIE